MWLLLPLASVLCVTTVRGLIDGSCPRKEPPPGVLVLSPGSKLVLTCGGHVSVDGVKVNVVTHISNADTKDGSPATTQANITGHAAVSVKSDRHIKGNSVSGGYLSPPAETGVGRVTEENKSPRFAGPTSPNAQTVQPTSVSSPPRGKSDREAEDVDYEGDYEEDEWEGGSRVTRGIKSRPEWKWNGRMVRKGNTFERRGATLSLDSVSLADSGKYTCHHRGQVRFSLKVTVADAPENPHLNCYKTSPSRKIRCEWTPQKPMTKGASCYLLLRKSLSETFLPLACSAQPSRCWCALDHDEDTMRTSHQAYLCITSISGNATSDLLYFTPLEILKPDPPSNVSVQEEEGHNRTLIVTWEPPSSWKYQDRYYKLIYEIQYKPFKSSFFQRKLISEWLCNTYIITDAMTGFEYEIQVRTKEEYDGHWSDWSRPVYGSSWKATFSSDDLFTTPITYPDTEGSGAEGSADEDPASEPHPPNAESLHILWISPAFALVFLFILAACKFSHRYRYMTKLQSISVVTQCRDSLQTRPSAPAAAPEGQALMTITPPHYKERPPNEGDEENEEEQTVTESTEAMNFNNTSYFLVQREW